MFNSPILDLAITLSFTYFILGLLVSTIHEFIFSVLAKNPKRSKYLKASIESLFFDSDWKNFVQQKLFKNVHIEALKQNNKPDTFPSYVPNANFALAVMDQFRDGNNVLDMARIKEILTNDQLAEQYKIPQNLRKVLLGILERANGELNKFQQNLEGFFSSAMDRLAGTYVRSTKKALFFIAVILAVSTNTDTVNIVRSLWGSPDALKQTANNIQAVVNEVKKDSANGIYSVQSPDGQTVELNTRISAVDSVDSAGIRIARIKENIKTSVMTLKNTGIPIGWDSANYPHRNEMGNANVKDANGQVISGKDEQGGSLFWGWVIKIFGLLLTSFALLLGAPFWFDLLNKIVNLRASGKKEGDTAGEPKREQPVSVTINQKGEGASAE